MKKQPKVTTATRQAVIDAFWTLYEQKRIEKITIKDITELAGYNRGTFYVYFMDIYDLLSQEEADIFSRLEEGLSAIKRSENMEDMLGIITNFYIINGKRVSLLIHSNNSSEFMSRLKKTLYPLFENALDTSQLKYSSIIYEFGINGMIMAFNDWFNNHSNLPVEDFINLLRSLVECGIFGTIMISYTDFDSV